MKDETGQISRGQIKKTFISYFRSWTIYYTEVTEKELKGTLQGTILIRCGFRKLTVTEGQGRDWSGQVCRLECLLSRQETGRSSDDGGWGLGRRSTKRHLGGRLSRFGVGMEVKEKKGSRVGCQTDGEYWQGDGEHGAGHRENETNFSRESSYKVCSALPPVLPKSKEHFKTTSLMVK